MRAGPKPQVTSEPLNLADLPASGGDRVIQSFLLVPKGTGAKKPFVLRPWQRRIVRGLFDDPRPRAGLVSIPRGNGKSTLAATLGLYELLADGVEGAPSAVRGLRRAAGQDRVHRREADGGDFTGPAGAGADVQDRLYVPGTDSTFDRHTADGRLTPCGN
jgi:hypothetical protein